MPVLSIFPDFTETKEQPTAGRSGASGAPVRRKGAGCSLSIRYLN
jgi:hypothetical protein